MPGKTEKPAKKPESKPADQKPAEPKKPAEPAEAKKPAEPERPDAKPSKEDKPSKPEGKDKPKPEEDAEKGTPKFERGEPNPLKKLRKIMLVMTVVFIATGAVLYMSEDAVLTIESFFSGLLGGSGSTEVAVKYIVMSNSTVREFMDNHTNATMQLSFFRLDDASLIFQHMRSDCGVSGNETEELYRVVIKDNSSEISLVAWVDWLERELLCVADKRNYTAPELVHHSYSDCYNNDLYWFDSFGNREGLKQSCLGLCRDGACAQNCVYEGQSANVSINATCCPGLARINDSEPRYGGMCIPKNETFACTRCGNDMCEPPENACNCPPDCNVTCTDSDKKDYYVQGTVTRDGVTIKDECENRGVLREYYCELNAIKSETYTCPKYYECYFGKCLNVTLPCKEAGDVWTKYPGRRCCPGLKEVNVAQPENDCKDVPNVFVCINCGDGECGPGKNICNCPSDCTEPEES